MNEYLNTPAAQSGGDAETFPRKIRVRRGGDSEVLSRFLRKILALQGIIVIALLEQRRGGGKPYWVHHKCATVEEAVAIIEAILAS